MQFIFFFLSYLKNLVTLGTDTTDDEIDVILCDANFTESSEQSSLETSVKKNGPSSAGNIEGQDKRSEKRNLKRCYNDKSKPCFWKMRIKGRKNSKY